MTIKNYKITSKMIKRLWGDEVRFHAEHIETGKIFDDVIICNEKDANSKIDAWLRKQEQAIAEKADPERTYTESEIESILKEKGYLDENQTLDDLTVKDSK